MGTKLSWQHHIGKGTRLLLGAPTDMWSLGLRATTIGRFLLGTIVLRLPWPQLVFGRPDQGRLRRTVG